MVVTSSSKNCPKTWRLCDGDVAFFGLFVQCPNCLQGQRPGWVRGHAFYFWSYLWDVSFTCLQISLELNDSDEGPIKAMLVSL